MKTTNILKTLFVLFASVSSGFSQETVVQSSQVRVVPDYDANLTLFYFLCVLLLVQVIAIFVLGGSLTSMVKSEIAKKKDNNALKTLTLFVGIGSLLLFSASANAMSVLPENTNPEVQLPWLLVENSDIYFMLVVNAIALMALLYMRRSFMEMFCALHPELAVSRKTKRIRKVNKVLTDAVPIEEEHTILMQHEYDGIRELDNNLPPWWVWGFYTTIAFAVIYVFNYHILKTSDLQLEAYRKDMKRAEKEVKAYMEKMAMNVDESNATLLTAQKDISAGKSIFEANCVSCHLQNGGGEIGPNLTDKNWIYGFDIKVIFGTVKNGTSKGMPEHNSKLNPVQIQQVASYVLNLPEVAGKDAEGQILEK